MKFCLGVDLGQRQDHTAMALVERWEEKLLVRYVERAPLGMPFSAVVERMRTITSDRTLSGRTIAVVDATGLGAPVVEQMRSARLPCQLAAVTITGGGTETKTAQGWNVPKRDLIAGVQVWLERGDLRIPRRMKDADALLRELQEVRSWRGAGGEMRSGAEGAGRHDDLAMALALAVWKGARIEKPRGIYGNCRILQM
jgi:phage FluMu gp28-like protein